MVDDGARESWNILVVDDSPPVLEITRLLLEDLGYQVVGMAGAESALQFVSGARAMPDLLIVDYRLGSGMDGMDGTELVEALRKRLGREIPALITSGDIRGEPSLRAHEAHCHFLGKPYLLRELLGTLSEIKAATDAIPGDGTGVLPVSTGGS